MDYENCCFKSCQGKNCYLIVNLGLCKEAVNISIDSELQWPCRSRIFCIINLFTVALILHWWLKKGIYRISFVSNLWESKRFFSLNIFFLCL